MAVNVTVSETFQGAAASDPLSGGGVGVDLSNVINGSFAPIISKPLNQGKQDLYVSHDGNNPITSVGVGIQQYGTDTGFTYGGAASAASDISTLTTMGQNSGSSKNNNDGLSGGLWVDMDRDSNDTTRFDFATNGIGQGGNDTVAIHGDNGTDGLSVATAFEAQTEAMAKDAGGGSEADADSPVAGQIGPSGNTALGEAAHFNYRIYIPQTQPDGGIFQNEWFCKYSFTD